MVTLNLTLNFRFLKGIWLNLIISNQGKMKIEWPGLNTDVLANRTTKKIKIIGEDVDREKRLIEIRNRMDKFRPFSTPPHERGFTGNSISGKSIGAPVSYDDGLNNISLQLPLFN